jgi:hypothetical protein
MVLVEKDQKMQSKNPAHRLLLCLMAAIREVANWFYVFIVESKKIKTICALNLRSIGQPQYYLRKAIPVKVVDVVSAPISDPLNCSFLKP